MVIIDRNRATLWIARCPNSQINQRSRFHRFGRRDRKVRNRSSSSLYLQFLILLSKSSVNFSTFYSWYKDIFNVFILSLWNRMNVTIFKDKEWMSTHARMNDELSFKLSDSFIDVGVSSVPSTNVAKRRRAYVWPPNSFKCRKKLTASMLNVRWK